MKEEDFPHTRKALTGGDDGWRGGSFRAMEESVEIGVRRAKWRDSCTEDWC